mmetsp:Transcript_2542/g.3415  ORF Transcript_2542/g.3415 Transcript_2542/m.3415 type:complete len:242 (-) Transcript_2542:1133-1858(-)
MRLHQSLLLHTRQQQLQLQAQLQQRLLRLQLPQPVFQQRPLQLRHLRPILQQHSMLHQRHQPRYQVTHQLLLSLVQNHQLFPHQHQQRLLQAFLQLLLHQLFLHQPMLRQHSMPHQQCQLRYQVIHRLRLFLVQFQQLNHPLNLLPFQLQQYLHPNHRVHQQFQLFLPLHQRRFRVQFHSQYLLKNHRRCQALFLHMSQLNYMSQLSHQHRHVQQSARVFALLRSLLHNILEMPVMFSSVF